MPTNKARVYGEDVVVRLYNDEFTQPFVIDFDSIKVSKIVDSKNYKTINKNLTTHHPIFNGWRVELTRAKRDNYLDEFVDILDKWYQGKYRFQEISIEHSTRYNSTAAGMIQPAKEFSEDVPNKFAQFVGGLAGNLLNKAQSVVNQNPFINQTRDAIIGGINTFLGIASFFKEPFREKWLYVGGTLAGFNHSDAPKENSMQTIVFNCVDRISNTDENAFTGYIEQLIKDDAVARHIIENTGSIPINAELDALGKPKAKPDFFQSVINQVRQQYGP